MYWANFLHIYQPPTQKEFWVRKIAAESYRKLMVGFKKNPSARVTLNINAVLTELFVKYDCRDIIADITLLAKRGQLEFTASAKYHPFLPLMPRAEIVRQIDLNTRTNRRYFGPAYQPTGFFPPEMAYNRAVADAVIASGYHWIILEELAYSNRLGQIDWNQLYTLQGHPDFHVFFREREASFRILSANIISGRMLLEQLGPRVHTDQYLITAMDGETFGHHRPGLEDVLFELYEAPALHSVTVSELPAHFTRHRAVEPLPSTWALMKRDIKAQTPYSRWCDRRNTIHCYQWRLTRLALQTVHAMNPKHPSFRRVRAALDRALHSDQYWWASATPWWSIEMIESGAKDLRDVIFVAATSPKAKELAASLYHRIIITAFEWQRSGKVDAMAKLADEDVTQRITTEMPYIPEAEFDAIVGNLEAQMREAAKALEYERAAQIRNRVTELRAKKHEITKR